jgi:hypothetical protein
MSRVTTTRTLILSAVAVSTVGAIVVMLLGGAQAVRGGVQLVLFPFLLILLSALSLRGVRLPRILVGLSAIGVLCGALVRYSDVGLTAGAFGVARFESDSLENKTRIFRDNVRHFVGDKPASVIGIINPEIRTEEDARKVLEERSQLGGVIWGSERWMNVSMRPTPPVALSILPPTSFAQRRLQELGISDLQLISYVPSVGFSKGLDSATFEYVGTLIRSTQEFPHHLREGGRSLEYEQLLLKGGSIRASWTSIRHLAAFRWMLGTFYLVRAISGPELEWGDIRCAEAAFKSARMMLRSGGNPALLAAVRNNESIVHVMKRVYTESPETTRKFARGRFQSALNLKKRSAIEESYWAPMQANLKALGKKAPGVEKKRR